MSTERLHEPTLEGRAGTILTVGWWMQENGISADEMAETIRDDLADIEDEHLRREYVHGLGLFKETIDLLFKDEDDELTLT